MKVFWLALLSALFWGIAPLFEKTGLAKPAPIIAMSVRTAVVAIGMVAVVTASGGWQDFQKLDLRTVAYIAIGALFAGILAQLIYYHALKIGDPSTIVPVTAAYPLIAAILSMVFLKDPVTPGKITGAVLVVLGILILKMDGILWPR